MPFAIIKTGGKQYRVTPGQTLEIEKLVAEAGTTLTFAEVLAHGAEDSMTVGVPLVSGATVTAEVVEQFRGKKIRVFTYKPKKRQRRTLGHRQSLTRIRITAINAA